MADFWVLIVDDEDGVLSVLKNSLRKLGGQFRVSTAAGGEEAMDMLIQRKYDLVVTDYKMAGMNGLELMEKVHAAHPQTRVILMTAYGSAAVESEASRLQAYRYLPKPLEIEAFRRIVREAAGSAADASGILVLSERWPRAASSWPTARGAAWPAPETSRTSTWPSSARSWAAA